MVSNRAGILYVVATPIGNLGDLTPRAVRVLADVDVVAAEDTRRTARLLAHAGIEARMVSLHEHNEAERVPELVARLSQGGSVALVSDAGTPLISDPGYRLLRAVRDAGLSASPVPGPCAAVAALSVAGLPTDRFLVEGFLPERAGARRDRLVVLAGVDATLVFFVAVHKLDRIVTDLVDAFGPDRSATLARELTKLHESVLHGTLGELADAVASGAVVARGEFVLVVAGTRGVAASDTDAERVLGVLLKELKPTVAARLAAQLTGRSRKTLYELALRLSR